MDLDSLKRKTIESDLPLKSSATNIVFGAGNPNADILIIGEAPGAQEDLQGLPFVGKAGKMLDSMLEKINLKREDIYIANILKYRPPNNRDPNPEEIRAHTPFLVEQIKIIKPKFICTLGNYSTKFVLAGFQEEGMKKIPGISQIHGTSQKIKLDNLEFTVFPLYHPAAVIYRNQWKQDLENDFIKLSKLL